MASHSRNAKRTPPNNLAPWAVRPIKHACHCAIDSQCGPARAPHWPGVGYKSALLASRKRGHRLEGRSEEDFAGSVLPLLAHFGRSKNYKGWPLVGCKTIGTCHPALISEYAHLFFRFRAAGRAAIDPKRGLNRTGFHKPVARLATETGPTARSKQQANKKQQQPPTVVGGRPKAKLTCISDLVDLNLRFADTENP